LSSDPYSSVVAPKKSRRGRPKGSLSEKTRLIREAIVALTAEYEVMTVRQVFYALVARGVVPKTENGGYRPVQRNVLAMRREGALPWSFVADTTRWRRKPETWNSAEEALQVTQRTYRRNLWRSQGVRVEVWLEKDALAGVLVDVTDRWDVSLMVSRGTSSATFVYSAAEAARDAFEIDYINTIVFLLYDFDAGGARAARSIEKGLREFAPGVPIETRLLAVTEDQIETWNLPTRPAKTSDPEAAKWGTSAVELDAIPPDKLRALVEDEIVSLIDPSAWHAEQAYEESERELLARMVVQS
jgi:hypothetical protein